MKHLILLILCVLATNGIIAQGHFEPVEVRFSNLREDTAEIVIQYSHYWDSDLNEWTVPFGLNRKSYSPENNLIESLDQSFLEDIWVSTSRKIYQYNTDGSLYDVISQEWITDGYWWGYNRIEYIYNILDLISSRITQEGDGTDWLNERLIEYTYSDENYLIEELLKEWEGSSWALEDRHSWVNNESGLPLKMNSQEWRGGEWVPDYEFDYSYDSINNLSEWIIRSWSDSTLANESRGLYSYEGTLVTEIISQLGLDDTLWVNNSKGIYTYAEFDAELSRTLQSWSGDQWVNVRLYDYTYDSENRLASRVQKNWSNGSWVNFRLLSYEYLNPSGIDPLSTAPNALTLYPAYPNPFNPSTTIEYQLPEKSDVSLAIYDIAGREVRTLVSTSQIPGSYNVTWNGTNRDGHQVAGGMYFTRLQAGEYSSVIKMVYLR
ncbi:MAG: T9SS type A sorting domain-containing protein [Candidatus Marinimicrobia bacterium]|nr:T9SS type A sorting domain-containing protein [Candidatus Neomarinimicrobiota bacterium]